MEKLWGSSGVIVLYKAFPDWVTKDWETWSALFCELHQINSPQVQLWILNWENF